MAKKKIEEGSGSGLTARIRTSKKYLRIHDNVTVFVSFQRFIQQLVRCVRTCFSHNEGGYFSPTTTIHL